MMKKILILLFLLAVGLTTIFAQTTNDYRSNAATYNWSTASSWERYNGSSWVTATSAPSAANAQTITIRNGHTVTVTTNVTADQVVVDNGGTITVSSNRTLTLSGNTTDNGAISTGTGTITVGTYVVSGTGSFTVNASGKLVTANTNGISSSSSSGSIQTSTRSFSSNATYEYNGSSNQITGNGLPSITQYIVLSGSNEVTLTRDTAIGQSGYTGSITVSSNSTLKLTESGVDIALNYGSMTVNGTIIFGSANLITGAESFSLNANAILKTANPDGIWKTASSGSIQTTGARNFYALSSYVFNGTTAQVTGDGMPTDVNKVEDLTTDNSAGVTLSQDVFVNGTLSVLNGIFDRDAYLADFDGYYSPTVNYLTITEDDDMLYDSDILMEVVEENFPTRVKRQWTIANQGFSDKLTRFYWTSDDDEDFDWTDKIPTLYDGATDLGSDNYDVSGNPRWIELTFYDSYPTGPITIGLNDGSGLPVELSSFTAVAISNGYVRMDWVTQSETGVLGYYLYRSTTQNLSSAELVSPLIHATNTSQETSYSFIDRELAGNGQFYYWLQSEDINGGYQFHGPASVTVENNGNDTPVIPVKTRLNDSYPNPFNPQLNISFDMVKAENVQILIYNAKGQKVRTLLSTPKNPGSYRIVWDGRSDSGAALSTGMYYVKMVTNSYSSSHKVMLMK